MRRTPRRWLPSTAGLSPGQEIWLDQLNDPALVNPVGNEGLNRCSGPHRHQPRQRWTHQGPASGEPGAGDQRRFGGAGWVKNVEIRQAPSRSVRFFIGYRNELRDSYIHDAQRVGSQAYGVELDENSASLIENNIFEGLVAGVMLGFPNNAPGSSWRYPSFNGHDAHNFMNLFEGNMGDLIYLDNIHGSGSHQTLYRNRLFGHSAGKTGDCDPLAVDSAPCAELALSRSQAVVVRPAGAADDPARLPAGHRFLNGRPPPRS